MAIAPTTRYFVVNALGDNKDFLDFGLSYGGGAISTVGEVIQYNGSANVDGIFVRPGMTVDATSTGDGSDNIYLSGSLLDYSLTTNLMEQTLTLSRTVDGMLESVTISAGTSLVYDNLVFANGQVSGNALYKAVNNNTALPVPDPATNSLTSPPLPTQGATVKAYAISQSGDTFATVKPGVNLDISGGGGVDKVYVTDGTNVDATDTGGANDFIYMRGNWADYTKAIDTIGKTITFTRSVGGFNEVVKVSGGSSGSHDTVVFADGAAQTNDAFTALKVSLSAGTAAIGGAHFNPAVTTPLYSDAEVAKALAKIAAAADANTATATNPTLQDYITAGVTGVTDGITGNLAAINSALDSTPINAGKADTTAEVQAIVNGYSAILASADGTASNTTTALTATQYTDIGVTGVSTGSALHLLDDVVDGKAQGAVDTVQEVQALADAANAVQAQAAGTAGLTMAQLNLLGVTGLSAGIMSGVSAAIAATDDSGNAVDTLAKIQTLVNGVPAATMGGVDLGQIEKGIGGFAVQGDVAYRDLSEGGALYSAGDVNGDGYEDFVVGSRNGHYPPPDSGAAWVVFGKAGDGNIDLNSLDATQGFKIINSAARVPTFSDGMIMGARIVGGGDFNGDGLADLLVAEPNMDGMNSTNVGKVWAVYGKADGTTVDVANLGNNGFTIAGAAGINYQYTGADIAVGDVNGDGLSDIIVRKASESPETSPVIVGSTYVIYGTANQAGSTISLGKNTISGASGFVIKSSDRYDYGGTPSTDLTTRFVGDVNGDGYGDLIVSTPAHNWYPNNYPATYGEGRAYVVFGKADNAAVDLIEVASGKGGFALNPEIETNGMFGSAAAALGDINGDGLADFAVGATGKDQNGIYNTGRAYVVFGKSDGAAINMASLTSGTSTQGFAILAENVQQAQMGYFMDGAGDINGDGMGDLVVATPFIDANGKAGAGRCYVVYGKADGATVDLASIVSGNDSLGFVINGANAGDVAGYGGARAAGDLNGDGFDDLLVGASRADVGALVDAGKAYVLFGGQQFATTVDFLGDASANTLTGTSAAETFVGGDGNDNLIGGGGADVMMGGRGDDTFVVDGSTITALASGLGVAGNMGQLAHINGGTGIDTLRLSGGANLDLSAISNTLIGSRLESIERIDMATDAAANVLTIQLKDVIDMSGMNLFNQANVTGGTYLFGVIEARHQVLIDGTSADSVNASGFVDTHQTAIINGHTYGVYNQGVAAQLLIDLAIVNANHVVL